MKRFFSIVAYLLVIIGALNWGLWGFFQFDVVAWLFHGNTTWLSRVIYSIIGLAGVWTIGSFGRCCRAMTCEPGKCPCGCSSGKCSCIPGKCDCGTDCPCCNGKKDKSDSKDM